MFNSTVFIDWFLIDDNIQFWVAEEIGNKAVKPQIIGTVGLKNPDDVQKEYMVKRSMKNGLELKASYYLF